MRSILLSLFIFPAMSFADSSSDLSQVLKDAKMVPVVRDGKVIEHAPVKTNKNGKMQKLGLKKMDVVRVDNGKAADRPTKDLNHSKRRKPGQPADTSPARDGKEMTNKDSE